MVSVLTILIIAGDECRQCFSKVETLKSNEQPKYSSKKFWIYDKIPDGGHLHHVNVVLDRLGYKKDLNTSDWDLLWAHAYPFRTLYQQLKNLKPHQRVNHFPGSGYITTKVDLATTDSKYIPPAFKLPGDKEKLLKYAEQYQNSKFVQKNNHHRNIKVEDIHHLDLDTEGTFIQKFVDNPLLINGHKFDIGIYTVITSVDPLRVYIYNSEALLRYIGYYYF